MGFSDAVFAIELPLLTLEFSDAVALVLPFRVFIPLDVRWVFGTGMAANPPEF
ncbi:hypothetical protein [Arthrobacter sp. SPG23]|uniref:hypothetical protein n=1 Tax=Arthrobacter sp. SPG23 TaxID=1610703 RepID=UPI000AC9AE5C|nr:hypothetical protein [Arthrobacter sp. SPG23]